MGKEVKWLIIREMKSEKTNTEELDAEKRLLAKH